MALPYGLMASPSSRKLRQRPRCSPAQIRCRPLSSVYPLTYVTHVIPLLPLAPWNLTRKYPSPCLIVVRVSRLEISLFPRLPHSTGLMRDWSLKTTLAYLYPPGTPSPRPGMASRSFLLSPPPDFLARCSSPGPGVASPSLRLSPPPCVPSSFEACSPSLMVA